MRRATTRVAVLGLIAVFSLGFLYIGSTHRDRCLKAGNVGCSILPWSGEPSSGGGVFGGGWGPTSSTP